MKPIGASWSDLGRVPSWIEQVARADNLNYIASLEAETLELSARLLPRVKTAAATVRTAEYSTELVAEAVQLSKQIYDDETPYASLYYTRKDLQR